jgi:hypothetical protein
MKRSITSKLPKMERRGGYSLCKGLPVKTGIRSGEWRCTACQGQAVGSNLIKPKCDYCELN